jgi:hypothetical protein
MVLITEDLAALWPRHRQVSCNLLPAPRAFGVPQSIRQAFVNPNNV